jgi:N-acetyl-D-muramate 6-phosphate phosphatase
MTSNLKPSPAATSHIRAVLFDLDGTVVDSVHDLAGTANDLREMRGLAPLPVAQLRPWVGSGASGMLQHALGITPLSPGFQALRDQFLNHYLSRATRNTHVFDEIKPILQQLTERAVPWGIVTNKATRYTDPIIDELGLRKVIAVLICGDTMPRAKPHPDPLLEAARRIGMAPAECVYIGDDLRDIQAAQAAGMMSVAATWGYLGGGEVQDWGADHIIDSPGRLPALLPHLWRTV